MRTNRRNSKKWKNLFLVRHGESTCNEVNRFAGSIDAPLTSLGEAQARKAAKSWKGHPPDRIYTSPLQRARKTAEILFPFVSNYNPTQHLIIDGRISERHFGDFTLRNKAFIQKEVGLKGYELSLYGDCAAMRGGENFEDFKNRILEFLRDEIHPLLLEGKRILIVAHKYVIELLCRLILRLSSEGGYDLRVPNALIMAGDKLRGLMARESRTANLIRDWIILHYSHVLLIGVIIGLMLNHAQLLMEISPLWPLIILATATGISMARVDLSAVRLSSINIIPYKTLIVRYILFPLAIGSLSIWASSRPEMYYLAIFLAAPSAITGITISRCMGGIILPTVFIILLSSTLSILVILPLLGLQGVENISQPAIWLVLIILIGLLIPFFTVSFLRARFPIETAKLAENNAATAIILLTLFVILSFKNIDLTTFWPAGLWVFVFALAIRILALFLTRFGSLYAVDDYIAMSYPNIFFVVVLASILGLETLHIMAAWFLLPMFALAPLDEFLCKKFIHKDHENLLISFLKIQHDNNKNRIRL